MATIFKSLKDAGDLKGKKVLLRLDLNVPHNNGVVVGDYRIKKILPTIKYLKEKRAKVIVVSHIGKDGKDSLKDIALYIDKFTKTGFVPSPSFKAINGVISNMKEGSMVILENIRKHKGEEDCSVSFAKDLASLADVYVNEAFSVSHRKHASVVALPKLLPSYAGFLFEEEYEKLNQALNPEKPMLLIVGGAKFDTKLPIIKKYLPMADSVFVSGALSNRIFKEKGYYIGKSLIDKSGFDTKSFVKNKKIVVPIDVVSDKGRTSLPDDLMRGESIMDVGDKTISMLKEYVSKAKFIIWNGPLGNYETGFDKHTNDLLKIIAKSKAKAIVGGGDTLVLVSRLRMEKKFYFASTAGGAMLEFLLKGTLPGIDALRNSKK